MEKASIDPNLHILYPWGILPSPLFTEVYRTCYLLYIPFVPQIFVAGSCSMAFKPSHDYIKDILSLLAGLHVYPHVGL